MAGKVNEATKTQIIALLSDSASRLSQREIAELMSVSVSTVSAIAKEVKPDIRDAQQLLRTYQGHINRDLPVEARSRRLAELAARADKDMVSLHAIKYVDELAGIVTAKASRQQELEGPAPTMFLFPAGSQPIINVNARPELREDHAEDHASDEKSGAQRELTVDATEVSDEDE